MFDAFGGDGDVEGPCEGDDAGDEAVVVVRVGVVGVAGVSVGLTA